MTVSLEIPERVQSRALTKVVVVGDCVESTYSTNSSGYAQIGWQDEHGVTHGTTAHRAAWVGYTGKQIPDELTVDHTCRNPRCVRRVHLRLRTNESNGRMNGQAGHYDPSWSCPRNHPASSRFRQKRGAKYGWSCRDCVNLSHQKYREKKRAA